MPLASTLASLALIGASFGPEAALLGPRGQEMGMTGTSGQVEALGLLPLGESWELQGGAYVAHAQGAVTDKLEDSGRYELTRLGLTVAPTLRLGSSRVGLALRAPVRSVGRVTWTSFTETQSIAVHGLELGLGYHYQLSERLLVGLEYDDAPAQSVQLKDAQAGIDSTLPSERRTLLLTSQIAL